MQVTTLFFTIAGVWVSTGLITGFIMGRRGHVPYAWTLLGMVLGPLVLPLAVDAARRATRDQRERVLVRGHPGSGPVDVLVGIDGSTQADAALTAVIEMLGPRIGSLALVSVLDYDAESSIEGRRIAEAAGEELKTRAARVASWRPETVQLSGKPDEVLAKYALEHGFELIAIGSRGKGLSKALLGSVAARLASGAPVPVLVVSG